MTASLDRAQQPSHENSVDPQRVIQGDLLCIRKYVSMYVVCSHCLEGVSYVVVLKNQLSS